MDPLTETQLRTSFVNASRREAAKATLPDLSACRWDDLDYLGWRDRKAPLLAYAVVPVAGEPVGILLRSSDAARSPRKALCAWCEDVVATDDVSLYVARRGGAPGRRGDSIGTLICTQFLCSRNVRRVPSRAEAGTGSQADRELIVWRRIAGLRERAARFAGEVRRTC
ncbi:FBP domain-containing protein [Isoptericola sp. b490]|uniref:FBP domain-containing protein n=1 Tax=Actinotalea lenta TaxID=3064654 RepID=UPI0027127835|nr:FBP domain-containing protein [Isoptericola sp. b490]MDO8120803.1 FBP domain-containing protein [Isoptericola sp. b490]